MIITDGSGPAHYRLGPSSSSRWLECPGSARDDLPDEDNNASLAGHAVHEVADGWMKDPGPFQALLANEAYYAAMQYMPSEEAAAIAECGVKYVEYVDSIEGEKDHEIKIQHDKITDFGGTIDTCIALPKDHLYPLHIVDMKTGKWKVPAKRSTQLMSYAVLACREHYGKMVDVTGTIIQSRVYKKPNTATFPAEQLRQLEEKIERIQDSDELNAGNHCYFCPLKFKCEEYDRVYGRP